jgi:hypothetical protein
MKVKVLLILSIMSIWILPIDLFAMTPVDGNYIQLNNVQFSFSGSGSNSNTWNDQLSSGFLFFTNGWGYLDYDGAGSLGNGLMPEGEYTIHSTNPRYSILQIGQIELNIFEYTYEFELFKGSNTYEIEFIETTDPLYDGIYIILDEVSSPSDYMYFRIYDNAYTEIDRIQSFNEGYQNGFDRATNEFAIESNGELYTASEWGVIQYNLGLEQGPENTLAIRNMIPGILGITFAFFFQLASVSFLGISALDLIGAVITIATSIFILRIFLNR